MHLNPLTSSPSQVPAPLPGVHPEEEEGTRAVAERSPLPSAEESENAAAALSVLDALPLAGLPLIGPPVSTPSSVGVTAADDGQSQASATPGAPPSSNPPQVLAVSQHALAQMPAQLSAQPAAGGAAPVSSAPSDSGESSTSELPDGAGTKPADQTGAAEEPSSERAGNRELSEEEQEVVAELKKRDREVREHEQAHLASAGQYARGGAQFEYQTGPDGHRYAVGGEVGIDTSKVPDDPQATIRKAQAIYRAALAPAEPSGQDRRVAAQARQMQSEAQAELAENRRSEGARPAGDEEGSSSVGAGSTDPETGTEIDPGMAAAGPTALEGAGPVRAVSASDDDLPEAGGIEAGTLDDAGFAGQMLDLLA